MAKGTSKKRITREDRRVLAWSRKQRSRAEEQLPDFTSGRWASKGEGRGKQQANIVQVRRFRRGKPRKGKVGCLPDGFHERKFTS